MKKYHITHLFTALLLGAVLPLCSCEQQENPSIDSGDVLTINATLDGELDVNTRSYSGDVSLVDKGFTIVGYLLEGQYAPETMTIAPNVFDKSKGYQAVSKLSATDTKFKIPLPQIGLCTEDEPTYLSVLAWTQGDTDTGYGITGHTENSSVGMPYLNINLRSPEGKQGDIVAAQKIDHQYDYVITAIDLDFKHILSKMSFVVKNSTETRITVKEVKLGVAENALYSKGKYTFNGSDSIGIYSDCSNYYPKKEYTPTGWITPTLTKDNTATLGELLLIPQKAPDGFFTIKLTYSVNSDAINTPVTRILKLKARDLQAGKNYIYTLDINAEAIRVISAIVGGWREAPTNALPMVPGECGDALLLLEGKDEPYQHTNGKLYWLDRSGYNHHCEIVNSGTAPIQWNNQDGYTLPGTGSTIKVPDLGQFNGDVLCELVCSLDKNHGKTYPTPISFQPTTSTRSLMTHINSSGALVFDYGQTASVSYQRVETTPPTRTSVDWDKRAFYAFSRAKSGYMSVVRNNSIYQESQSTTANNAAQLSNGVIGPDWKGVINYVKIVRANKTVAEVERDYNTLKDSYKFDDNLTKGDYLPPVETGLVFCYDARSGAGSVVWPDQSIYKRHITNRDGNLTFSNNKVANFNNTRIWYEEAGLMNSQSFTLEIISKTTQGDNTIISFHPQRSGSGEGNRQIQVHLPWSGQVAFNSPGGSHRLEVPSNNIDYRNLHEYSFIRNPANLTNSSGLKIMEIWQDDTKSTTDKWANNVSPITSLVPIGFFSFGGQYANTSEQYFTGQISAVRLYNRALTKDEIKRNSDSDKRIFGF